MSFLRNLIGSRHTGSPPAPPPRALPEPAGDQPARAAWLLSAVVNPALADLAKRGIPSDDRARVLLLAIAGQESLILHRDQVDTGPAFLGPALGLWQFERGGGVKGVLNYSTTKAIAGNLCAAAGVAAEPDAAWRALKVNDTLACHFARLLLWTDWKALPHVDDSPGGWDMYQRCWRPGKPHPDKWSGNWRVAQGAVLG